MRDLDKIRERALFEVDARGIVKLLLVGLIGAGGAWYAGYRTGVVEGEIAAGVPAVECATAEAPTRLGPEHKFIYEDVLGKSDPAEEAPAVAAPVQPGGPAPIPTAMQGAAAAPPPTPVEANEPAAPGEFTVEVMALRSGDEAIRIAGHLRKSGYDASVREGMAHDREMLHRICVGQFGSQREAVDFQRHFEAREGLRTVVGLY